MRELVTDLLLPCPARRPVPRTLVVGIGGANMNVMSKRVLEKFSFAPLVFLQRVHNGGHLSAQEIICCLAQHERDEANADEDVDYDKNLCPRCVRDDIAKPDGRHSHYHMPRISQQISQVCRPR